MTYHSSLAALRRDPRFAALIKKHGVPDLHHGRNAFQALCRSIIYQQVSGKAAASILARFIDLFGSKSFPTPNEVRAVPIETLRRAGLSAQKASYLKDLAEKFADGVIKYRSLPQMQNDEIIEHLMQVKGIGVWTVHMFLIFTLGRPDILPTGDLGIQKGFKIVYGLRSLPSHAQMEKLARSWRQYASIASWYLWRAADEEKERSTAPKRLPQRK